MPPQSPFFAVGNAHTVEYGYKQLIEITSQIAYSGGFLMLKCM